MAKIKKLVNTIPKYSINDSSKVFCDDVSAIVSGVTGDIISIIATFPSTYNGLKAIFCTKTPADATSTTAPNLSGYNVVGSSVIASGTCQLVLTIAEWSNLSVTAYVVPANNGTTAAGTAELA